MPYALILNLKPCTLNPEAVTLDPKRLSIQTPCTRDPYSILNPQP